MKQIIHIQIHFPRHLPRASTQSVHPERSRGEVECSLSEVEMNC